MFFTVNTAFVNYLDQMDNVTNIVEFPILKNKTTFEQTLPISLNVSKFDSDLLTAPRTLKMLFTSIIARKKFLFE